MHVIPESWAHFHILVTVLPSVGLFFVLCFYVGGMFAKSEAIKRSCLVAFMILGLLAIPTYYSGEYSVASVSENPRISKDALDYHYGWGVAALWLLGATGFFALVALWRARRTERISDNSLHLVLGLALLSLAFM